MEQYLYYTIKNTFKSWNTSAKKRSAGSVLYTLLKITGKEGDL